MYSKKFFLFFFFLLFLFVWRVAGGGISHFSANAATGIDKETGGFLIHFSWDPIPPVSGEKTTFEADLVEKETSSSALFDAVVVEIDQEEKNVAMFDIVPNNPGKAAWGMTFPHKGTYRVTLQFRQAGEQIAQESFLLAVAPPSLTESAPREQAMSAYMAQLFADPYLLFIIMAWSLVWKGLALWRAGQLRHKTWFVVLLIVNTVGILDILYLVLYRKKRKIKIS